MKTLPLPPASQLHELLAYEPETGALRWKVQKGSRALCGSKAGSRDSRGYTIVRINKKSYRAARIIWLLQTGQDPGARQIDHINGLQCDDRFCNLRLATHGQNKQNTGLISSNRSGHSGVYLDSATGKWRACIKIGYKTIQLGRFNEKAEAVNQRKNAELRYFGTFAPHVCRGG